VVHAHRFIAQHLGDRALRVWSSQPNVGTPPFRAISSTYLWGWVLVNETLPLLSGTEAATLQPGTRMVLLMNRQGEADQARESLRQFGFDLGVVAQEDFGPATRPFRVVVADLVRVDAK
jgi:hypothetical protein